MDRALQIVSIIISILLIVLVLLQMRVSLGDLLGGGDGGVTRRGLERPCFS